MEWSILRKAIVPDFVVCRSRLRHFRMRIRQGQVLRYPKGAPPSESSGPSGSVPAEVTVTHPLGTATVKTNPATVVVFDYGTLDTLDKLGIEVKAVPQDNLPEYLAKYKDTKYENAGTLFEPDFEKLSKLKPDLILIGARTAEAYSELSKLAPTILISVDNASYMQSFEENAGIIGQIFTKEIAVGGEISAIKAGIADLKGKSEGAGKALIVMTIRRQAERLRFRFPLRLYS